MQEQNENTNLFFENILLWNLMLQLAIIHSFCTKSMGSAQPMTHKEKERKKKYFCHWSSLDHVLSIKTFTDKKPACIWLFVYLG